MGDISNFIEIALRHGCSPVNLLHIFRTPSFKNISGRLFLDIPVSKKHRCREHFDLFGKIKSTVVTSEDRE